jgi:outer membrane protein assembly factor BamB
VQVNLQRGQWQIEAYDVDDESGALVPVEGYGERSAGAAVGVVLSEDGSRLYTHTTEGALMALDVDTGGVVWTLPLGYAGERPPTVTADGYLMALAPGKPIGLVRDAGSSGDWVFRTGAVRRRDGRFRRGSG